MTSTSNRIRLLRIERLLSQLSDYRFRSKADFSDDPPDVCAAPKTDTDTSDNTLNTLMPGYQLPT